MRKWFILSCLPTLTLLSSCTTYKAELYPCDFDKYKDFNMIADTKGYGSNINSAILGALFSSGFDCDRKRDDSSFVISSSHTNGIIFPPHFSGRSFVFKWDLPPKTTTIIATDSKTGEKLFAVYYSRYMISMDNSNFFGRIGNAVKYCIKELKKSPPKGEPRIETIPSSYLNKDE